jgi:hypothetical protein
LFLLSNWVPINVKSSPLSADIWFAWVLTHFIMLDSLWVWKIEFILSNFPRVISLDGVCFFCWIGCQSM